jgi:hypothetical protein
MKKQVGDRVTARDKTGNIIWQPTIKGIAKLRRPTDYEPALMLVEHKDGKKELYLAYWKIVDGKQRFANRPPMFPEKVWLELLTGAIGQGFFSKDFLKKLAISTKGALAK